MDVVSAQDTQVAPRAPVLDTQRKDVIVALAHAIKRNDDAGIRAILAAHPALKWDDTYDEFYDCSCPGCGGYTLKIGASFALGDVSVALSTFRVLFDAGFIGHGCAGFLEHLRWNCSRRKVARNFFAVVEWYDPSELIAFRSRDGETIVRLTYQRGAISFQELRAPYIAWLNKLLAAGMQLGDDDVLELAKAALTHDAATRTVTDAMPELQTDKELFPMWRQRFYNHLVDREVVYVDETPTLAQRCAEIQELADSYPYEQYLGGWYDTDQEDD
jgi:hypothetical protein